MEQPDAARLSDVIAAIWEAAAEPAGWEIVLQGMSTLMPECKSGVVMTPFAEGSGTVWATSGAPAGFMEEYYSRWLGRDTTLHAVARRMPIDLLIADRSDLIPEPERCDIWQELYVPHGFSDLTTIIVNGGHSGGAEALFLATFSENNRRQEGSRRRQILTSLSRHFRGAAAIHWRLVRAKSDVIGTKSILDRINLGIVTLNRQSLVIEANQAARRIIDAGDRLFLAHGKIGARAAAANSKLQKAVAAVLAGSAEQPVAISRDHGPALTVIVTPMAIDREHMAGSTAKAIMFISDPELIPDQAGARVGALYGLTKAEAEVAEAMAAGSDAAESAKARGTSINTTRTQIKAMMGKIGATRQSDIVRAILAVPILDPQP